MNRLNLLKSIKFRSHLSVSLIFLLPGESAWYAPSDEGLGAMAKTGHGYTAMAIAVDSQYKIASGRADAIGITDATKQEVILHVVNCESVGY